MKPVTSIGEARRLPEKTDYIINRYLKDNGTIVHALQFRDLVTIDRDEKDILTFIDDDGRLMQVNYDKEGAYKTQV